MMKEALEKLPDEFNNHIVNQDDLNNSLDRADELLNIKLDVQPLNQSQDETKKQLDQNKQHLQKLVRFKILIDSHI